MNHLGTIKLSIHELTDRIEQADRQLRDWESHGDDFLNPSWLIETCFLQILAIIEALGLEELRKMAYFEYIEIKKSKDGFTSAALGPDDDIYSTVLGRIRAFRSALVSFCPIESQTKVTKDLLQIVRDTAYVITDKTLFGTSPSDENDVHLRIEGILKCIFPDLKHKPTLTKQIKNFEPDTGIPSIATLIEYKFLASKKDVPRIADEVLADTRGYVSNDWKRFLYVIYETHQRKTGVSFSLSHKSLKTQQLLS